MTESGLQDFDAWRAERRVSRQPGTTRIFGQDVVVPTSLSLDLAMRLDDEAESDDPDTIRDLVGELYGRDELERWRQSGCTIEDFELLLAWGAARARGQQISFDEAARRLDAERSGKAGNRAQRRGKKKRKR